MAVVQDKLIWPLKLFPGFETSLGNAAEIHDWTVVFDNVCPFV